MLYSLKQLAQFCEGKYIGNDSVIIQQIITDSRTLLVNDSTLFVALQTEHNDGHHYIDQLIKQGVKSFLVNQTFEVKKYRDANFIVVENTLKALQNIASAHRKQFNIPVVGITGSNGKTIVKDWLALLLNKTYKVCQSPKSYNSQLGVALSVLQLKSEHQIGIFEAGISLTNEMQALEQIIQPSLGILTNIGSAHLENFESKQILTAEKVKLFAHCKEVILRAEDIDAIGLLTKHNNKFVTWSKDSTRKADIQFAIKTSDSGITTCEVNGLSKTFEIQIPFVDEASIENAMHVAVAGLLLNVSIENIQETIKSLNALALRLEQKQGINNCLIINDSYSNDFASLKIAIDYAHRFKQYAQKAIVLSDILQSGENQEVLYSKINETLVNAGFSRVIGVGEEITKYSHLFTLPAKFFKQTHEFINQFSVSDFNNELILIKGARKYEFEHIGNLLQLKSHETVMEINLNDVLHNYHYFKTKLKPKTKLMAMVKALSYGSGSFEIANLMQHHQADYLAVAYADEGITLRRAGITMPIMVMNTEPESIDAMLEYGLEPEIFSISILEKLIAKWNQKANHDQELNIHLKLDTGMHRLGFEMADMTRLLELLDSNKGICVKSIFSHLAGSDAATHDDFSKTQCDLFQTMAEQIELAIGYKTIKHIANSHAIDRLPFAEFDMVRLGIGLYGISYETKTQEKLVLASQLKTTISQIKTVNPPDTIGYGRYGKPAPNTKIATIAIGYADGFPRALSKGNGEVYIHNKPCKVIGNVCMDMTMIDVTGLDCKEGDSVVVFETASQLWDLSRKMNTIPYEVLTSISARVKRVYYMD